MSVTNVRIPPYTAGLEALSASLPSQRMAYLQNFASHPLTLDERIELKFLILKDKCLFYHNQDDFSSDVASLVQEPYSTLGVAYKQLGSICYDNFLLGKEDPLNLERREQLLKRIDSAVSFLKGRTAASEAKARCLNAAASVKAMIEIQQSCPLLHLVRRVVDKTLVNFGLTSPGAEAVNAILLTIQVTPKGMPAGEYRLNKGDLACIPKEELSYSVMDETIVRLWFELMPQTTGADLILQVGIVTPSNYGEQSYSASI